MNNVKCLLCNEQSKWRSLCRKHYYEQYNKINKVRIAEVNKKYRLRYIVNGPLSEEEKKQRHFERVKKEKETTRRYNISHKTKLRQLQINWKKRNFDYVKNKLKEKYKNDANYRVGEWARRTLGYCLWRKGAYKEQSTFQYLGCSKSELRKYIEKQFKPGMTWKNHGLKGWHIDHIKPIASFDFTKEEDKQICFHYTNLQPLWWYDNLKKRDKVF